MIREHEATAWNRFKLYVALFLVAVLVVSFPFWSVK